MQKKTEEVFLFHVLFLAREWNVLAGSYGSTILHR